MTTAKQERHKIYKLMLELYLSEDFSFSGFCSLVTYIKFQSIYKVFNLGDLPELYAQKPADAILFWFPTEDRKSRITILMKCIKLTKPETNEKTPLLL